MANDNEVRMYILMRTDMDSLTAGRAIAQGTHAANNCIGDMRAFAKSEHFDAPELLREWEKQTSQHFGTAIVLAVSGGELDEMLNAEFLDQFNFGSNVYWGIVNDPDYSVRDGDVIHKISVDTCGWIFGRKSDVSQIIEGMPLY